MATHGMRAISVPRSAPHERIAGGTRCRYSHPAPPRVARAEAPRHIGPMPPVDLFHVTHGKGPPLLCMHGGPGLDHSLFRPWLDPLGENATLIYYDHRGNGRSPAPVSWDSWGHTDWVRDAEALRAELGYERVVLLGHSWGGFLALEYAHRHPDRVAGLILVNTTPVMDYPEVVAANAQAQGTPEIAAQVMTLLANPVADDAALAEGFRAILPLYFHRYDHAVGTRLVAELVSSASAFNHGFGRCVPQYDAQPWLAGLAMPVLITAGRHDWIMPPAQGADRLAAGIRGAEYVVFEESGHFPFVEEQRRFLALVGKWLSEREAA